MLFTKNLILREFHISDLKLFYENSQDEQTKKYSSMLFYADENTAREDLERYISNYLDMKLAYYLAIIKKDTNILIGHIGIFDSDIFIKYGSESDISKNERGYGGYEIEYAISKEYRCFGYASEALKIFAPWCKNKFATEKIGASIKRQNIASYKTLLNAGFTLFNEETEWLFLCF
jgi:RimJ/RimL family protein N-acetyltransferase